MSANNPNLFSQLLLWQKFVILGMITLVLVVVPSYLYFSNSQQAITSYERVRIGLNAGSKLMALLKSTQKHRGLMAVVLFGDKSKETDLQKEKLAVNQAIADFDNMANSFDDPQLSEKWQLITNNWQRIENGVAAVNADRNTLWEMHSHQIDLIKSALQSILGDSNMTLDAYPQSYFLVQGIMINLPELFDQMGLARAYGREFLERALSPTVTDKPADKQKHLEMEQYRGLLAQAVNMSRSNLKNNADSLLLSVDKNSELKDALVKRINDLIKASEVSLKLSEQLIDAKTTSYPTISEYRGKYNTATDATYELITESINALNSLIDQQIDLVKQSQYVIITIILLSILLGTSIAVYIVNSITQPVNRLAGVMKKVAVGESIRVNMNSYDEIGILGRQFDSMLDEREAINNEREATNRQLEAINNKIIKENENLNSSIIELLYAVAKLAKRDLTAKAIVAEDVTGPVSDALNLLARETSKVLNKVLQIANDVSSVSEMVQNQATLVINVATDEKREVETASAELVAASKAMNDISLLAFSCNEMAQKAITNTVKAQSSVSGTVQGIAAIRDTIRETEKRIKRLGERSQEIGGVVTLINDISERTHILAINASMHAASAGEAGRGFAVVANEVQKLAENSRAATSKIAELVNNIQVETAETVMTMNDAISQVVYGTDLAQQAGQEMGENRDTTAELVKMVQRIAESSASQSATSARLVDRAQQIQNSTNQTYDQLQEQGRQTERLVDLSNALLASVNVFTLPKAAA